MFIPRNIEKRSKELEIIKFKELKDYETFIKDFQYNLDLIKDKTSDNPKEQFFINLIKNSSIKLDQTEYPFDIFLIENDKLFFYYIWKSSILWCSNDLILVIESKFNNQYETWQDFIKNMLEKHFKFRPSIIFIEALIANKMLEKHFKFKPFINKQSIIKLNYQLDKT